MKDKIPCVYAGADPNLPGVTHVVIQTNTTPPYVAYTYSGDMSKLHLPDMPNTMILLSLSDAMKLLNFKKGGLEDCLPD